MALEEFDFSKNYNFSGVFWFENEFNSRFSGTLEYTPEKGIKLLLVSTVLNGTDYLLLRDFCAIQKMYGTLQYEGKSVNITLLDIVLGERSNTFGGNGCSRTFEGSARFLILDILLKTNRIKSLNIEYDDNFKSIFFYHISPEEVVEVQPYTKNAVRLSNANISFDVFYMSTPFYSADQLDDMLCDTIWHTKKSPMKELKEIVSKFLETHQHEIGIRKKTRSVVKIKSRSSDLRKYIEIENKWRSFFELIIDKPIIIKNASIGVDCISVDNRKYSTQKAIFKVLQSQTARINIKRHISLAAIFSPWTTATDRSRCAIKITRQLASGNTTVSNRRMCFECAGAVDNQVVRHCTKCFNDKKGQIFRFKHWNCNHSSFNVSVMIECIQC